jgi:hypothetical protein
MRKRPSTLSLMGRHEPTERLLGFLCDVVLEQGGDWDATEAVLRDQFTGTDLEIAYGFATVLLIAYAEPGGPAFLRGMRDRRRRLVPADPARHRWGWKATG